MYRHQDYNSNVQERAIQIRKTKRKLIHRRNLIRIFDPQVQEDSYHTVQTLCLLLSIDDQTQFSIWKQFSQESLKIYIYSLVHKIQIYKKHLFLFCKETVEAPAIQRKSLSHGSWQYCYKIEILQRPLIALSSLFFVSISYLGAANKKLSKDKQLFLIIAFSNISKAFNSTKVEGFQAIKYTSRQNRITYNKAKIIALQFTISKLIDSSLQKAFKKIKQLKQERVHFLHEDNENDDDQDQQDIMIESFKSLAFNLRKMYEKQKTGKDIVEVKKQEGAKNMLIILDQLVRDKMKWTFWELNWNCRNEYSPQTYQILVRQIAVLQKQYQST